jgi:hypothetical protein
MDRVSRRSLLATASATAAAAGVAAVVRPTAADAATPAAAPAAAPPAAPLTDHVVARVADLRTGQVDLFLGERQVTVVDASLAHAIARAAQQHTV